MDMSELQEEYSFQDEKYLTAQSKAYKLQQKDPDKNVLYSCMFHHGRWVVVKFDESKVVELKISKWVFERAPIVWCEDPTFPLDIPVF